MSLTLYHAPGSSSARMLWLLEELEADYTIAVVRPPGEDGPPNPHPHGFAPALEHDGRVVTESGAIALYLTDLFPHSPVGVPASDPLRGAYLTWLFYQVGLTEPLVFMAGAQMLQQAPARAQLNDAMWRHIEEVLTQGPYILGARFTAVDVLYASLFEQARPILPQSAVLDAYTARSAARPARLRAQAKDAALAPAPF